MKIELVRGCVCDSFTIDDKRVIDMTPEELRNALREIVETADDETVIDCIEHLVTYCGEYECINERCECCGDSVSKWTWENE